MDNPVFYVTNTPMLSLATRSARQQRRRFRRRHLFPENPRVSPRAESASAAGVIEPGRSWSCCGGIVVNTAIVEAAKKFARSAGTGLRVNKLTRFA